MELENELLKKIYNKYFKRFGIDFVNGEIKNTKNIPYTLTSICLNFNDDFVVKIFYEKEDETIMEEADIIFYYRNFSLLSYEYNYADEVFLWDSIIYDDCSEKIKNIINYYNDNIKQEFLPMLQFIDNYYKKLHETNHYANLKATLTFLLITKNYEIGLHKDIAIIIAKKILFFIVFCFLFFYKKIESV